MANADIADPPKPSVTGQAVTFQSLLQYVLMAGVGVLGYMQNEASKSAAWARAEVVEARKEGATDRDKASADRDKASAERESLRKAFDQALAKLSVVEKQTDSVKADVAKVQKVAEKTQKAVESIEP